MRSFSSLSICMFVVIVGVAGSGTGANQKPPWTWTDDERIGARFDAIEKGRHAAPNAMPSARSELRYEIDGSRTPEVFMPYELFDALLSGGIRQHAGRDQGRHAMASGLRALGVDPDKFWPTLESVTRSYIALKNDRGVHVDSVRPPKYADLCRSRFVALNSARAQFPDKTFDRILYELVAPQMHSAYSTTDPNAAQQLRFEAGGCK